jgi:uncharacterized membrane protein
LTSLPKLLVALAMLAYPVVVYVGLGQWSPASLAALLVALVLLRAWVARDPVWLAAAAGVALLGVASAWGGSALPLKLYPVLVSAVLLAVFGASVLRPPTVVERIARLAEPQLPAQAVPYTRKVTLAWCAFFVLNGSIAAATAFWGSDETWLLYNGLLAYLLMGAMFAVELVLRRRMRRRLALQEGMA